MHSEISSTSSSNASSPPRRWPVLALVVMAGISASYWVNFMWFYLKIRWETSPALNLIFNAGFGLLYMIGCLAMTRIALRFAVRSLLLAGFGGLILLTILSSRAGSPAWIGAIILTHAFVVTWTWPNLEALIARGLSGPALGSAVGRYNIAWAGASAFSYAVMGRLYEIFPWTPFVIPCGCWATATVLVWVHISAENESGIESKSKSTSKKREDENMMKRLSRTGNMASYVFISAMIPIMPMVTEKLGLRTGEATAFGSIWLATRVIAFLILERWHGWHFKMGWFAAAILSLPILFGVITLSPSLIWVGLAELVLGFSIGMIYTSSLFYSLHGEAETKEAAIHEAIIGFGIMLGPLMAAGAGYWGKRNGHGEIETIAIAVVALLVLILGAMGWQLKVRRD